MIIIVVFVAGFAMQLLVPAEWWQQVGQYIDNVWLLLMAVSGLG